MNISKTSWHYRLLNFFDHTLNLYDVKGFPPRDLCSYMRSVLWAVVWPIAILASLPFYSRGVWMWLHHLSVTGFWSAVCVIVFIVGSSILLLLALLLTIAAVVFSCLYIHEKIKAIKDAHRDPNATEVEAEPGVVVSWFRAMKKKICPLLTVVD